MIMTNAGIYSSSKMKANDIKNKKKLLKRKTLVEHKVALCLQYWNSARMIELSVRLESHAKFLPSFETSKSWRYDEAHAK